MINRKEQIAKKNVTKKAEQTEEALLRRARFIHLLDAYEITQLRSAELIAAVTERPCSDRAVRSWINDPTKRSSSPCPVWALNALEKAIRFIEQAVARRAEALESKASTNA